MGYVFIGLFEVSTFWFGNFMIKILFGKIPALFLYQRGGSQGLPPGDVDGAVEQ